MNAIQSGRAVVICASCGATAPAVEAECAAWRAWEPDLEPAPDLPAVRTIKRCARCGSTALAQTLCAFRAPAHQGSGAEQRPPPGAGDT